MIAHLESFVRVHCLATPPYSYHVKTDIYDRSLPVSPANRQFFCLFKVSESNERYGFLNNTGIGADCGRYSCCADGRHLNASLSHITLVRNMAIRTRAEGFSWPLVQAVPGLTTPQDATRYRNLLFTLANLRDELVSVVEPWLARRRQNDELGSLTGGDAEEQEEDESEDDGEPVYAGTAENLAREIVGRHLSGSAGLGPSDEELGLEGAEAKEGIIGLVTDALDLGSAVRWMQLQESNYRDVWKRDNPGLELTDAIVAEETRAGKIPAKVIELFESADMAELVHYWLAQREIGRATEENRAKAAAEALARAEVGRGRGGSSRGIGRMATNNFYGS